MKNRKFFGTIAGVLSSCGILALTFVVVPTIIASSPAPADEVETVMPETSITVAESPRYELTPSEPPADSNYIDMEQAIAAAREYFSHYTWRVYRADGLTVLEATNGEEENTQIHIYGVVEAEETYDGENVISTTYDGENMHFTTGSSNFVLEDLELTLFEPNLDNADARFFDSTATAIWDTVWIVSFELECGILLTATVNALDGSVLRESLPRE